MSEQDNRDPEPTISNLADIVWAHPENLRSTAIIFEPHSDDCRTFDYQTLADEVARLAGFINAATAPGARVALLGDNSVGYVTAALAAVRCGRIVVPLSPRQGKHQIEAVLDEAEPALIFVDDQYRPMVPTTYKSEALDSDSFEDLSGPAVAVAPGGEQVAVQLYTSGSSGRPKGVLLSHRALLWPLRLAVGSPANSSVRAGIAAPLFHMNGLQSVLSVLAAGGVACLYSRFDADRYLSGIAKQNVTVIVGVPTMFSMLVDALARRHDVDVGSVRAVVSGSAPLNQEQQDAIQTAFPGALVQNVYGTTEAFGIFGQHPGGLATPKGAVGAAQPGVEIRLEGGPTPSEGRMLVRTPASMSGYYRDDDATRQKFGDGWYDTGDVMRVDDDGFYYVLGRSDDMIICGGEKVYPASVESVLESHPGVRAAAVVGAPDPLKGQVPIAFVVPSGSSPLDPQDLKAFALETGPAYAHPRRIEIVGQLPLTPTGKVDKRALRISVATADARRP